MGLQLFMDTQAMKSEMRYLYETYERRINEARSYEFVLGLIAERRELELRIARKYGIWVQKELLSKAS